MQNAEGITPREGAQVQNPSLCASCHTILLPVFYANGNRVIENGEPKSEYEQTTFFERLEQRLHNYSVPAVPHAGQLPGQSAAIQNREYRGRYVPRRAGAWALDAPARRRSDAGIAVALSASSKTAGINLFALEMFDQFRAELGLFKFDPNLPNPLAKQIFSQKTAVAEAVTQAQTSTADSNCHVSDQDGGDAASRCARCRILREATFLRE